MEFLEPRSLEEAIGLGSRHGESAKYVAGGTAVVLMLRQGLLELEHLISLNRLADVPTLGRVEVAEGRLRIGAGVSLTTVAASPEVARHAPDLAHAAAVVGNLRVRNAATLCGNAAEADHGSDPPAVLVNRRAEVVIATATGERREPMGEFLRDFYTTSLAPGEVVTAIEVPTGAFVDARYVKFTSRSSEDRPCVGLAAGVTLAEGRIQHLALTIGASTATPRRLDQVTDQVRGQVLDADVAREVAARGAAALEPISDARGSAAYRRRVVEVLIRRTLEDVATRTP